MRRLLVAAVAVAGFAALPAPAGATNECRGLLVCVPVAGPWVVVPARGAPRPRVEYELRCPRGYIVAGLDAELSERAIDVAFAGQLGTPVSPGVTTSRVALFVASYVGATARAPTFRPHIGCVPAAGGGRRVPTSSTVFRPGHPSIRRVRTLRIRPGAQRVVSACRGNERLVAASHAFGFFTRTPPDASLVASVRATEVVRGRQAVVVVRGDAEIGGVRAVVQVHAVCSRAR